MKRIHIKIKILNHFNLRLSCDLKYKISSFIYKSLNDDELHENKGIKNFTFSDIFFEKYKHEKGVNKILSETAGLIISSSEEGVINKLINKLTSNLDKIHQIDKMFFKISAYKEEVCKSDDNLFLCEFMTHSFLSKPNPTEKGKPIWLNPKDDEYMIYLKKHLDKRFGRPVDYFIKIDEDSIRFNTFNIKGGKVGGYKYRFIIKISDKETFNSMYYSGIGGLCSQGFGLINVLKSDKI